MRGLAIYRYVIESVASPTTNINERLFKICAFQVGPKLAQSPHVRDPYPICLNSGGRETHLHMGRAQAQGQSLPKVGPDSVQSQPKVDSN